VLERTFVLMKDEAMGGWRELYKEELCHFCPLPIVITMITSRRMRSVRQEWVKQGTHICYRLEA
jgi:hypothetical protein